jgi:Mn2+/Fe2+ NRAMP family transporter
LGTVTRVGHARMIRERFGRWWVALAVFDLFLLNFLTLLTEFIGAYFGMAYFGVPKLISVSVAGVVMFTVAATGRFRWWERFIFALILAASSSSLPPCLPTCDGGRSGSISWYPPSPVGCRARRYC